MLKSGKYVLFLFVTLMLHCNSAERQEHPPFDKGEPGQFKSDQLRYQQVREAYESQERAITGTLQAHGIDCYDIELMLLAFKEEKELEVWGKHKNDRNYSLLMRIPFCRSSGTLGPKRSRGDRQIPEGLYHIDRYNPASNFLLSLGLNYPNASDRKRASGDPGGDIFIHGSCVTIGCIPITDEKIRKLYILAVEARDHGQTRIPVYLFPFRMTETRWSGISASHPHREFWAELKTAYDAIQAGKAPVEFRISAGGVYLIP